ETVRTPYGDAALFRVVLGGRTVLFLARHGAGHALPPHRVNYRANIWALQALGVEAVLATQAVGSLTPHLAPGHFVLLSQFLDFTKARTATFFDGDGPVVHADVTHPYCPRLGGAVLRAGAPLGDTLHSAGVYACMEGPRFETAAEIRALRLLGADVVGMTNVPEVVLAREAGLCYAAVCIVCNWGAGMTNTPLSHREVLDIMEERADALRDLITRFAANPHEGDCACRALGFPDLLPTL
ncbi:MAG TPA: S-methyl-5'-thioinosine phosphorylase, partial [Armatimonadota bacterium]|nr:S-methyl-5'-thioinosine phosphorylase [Armatimonadota bacterium]